MSAYKSKTRKMRDALVAVLTTITYDAGSGAEPAFGLVTGDPSAEFQQEPYLLVYPAPTTDGIGATGQHDRAVGFALILLLSLETAQRTQHATYDYMYDLSELILDKLDTADFTDALNAQDSSIGTWLMAASRGTFSPAETKSGAILLCTIDLTISYSRND